MGFGISIFVGIFINTISYEQSVEVDIQDTATSPTPENETEPVDSEVVTEDVTAAVVEEAPSEDEALEHTFMKRQIAATEAIATTTPTKPETPPVVPEVKAEVVTYVAPSPSANGDPYYKVMLGTFQFEASAKDLLQSLAQQKIAAEMSEQPHGKFGKVYVVHLPPIQGHSAAKKAAAELDHLSTKVNYYLIKVRAPAADTSR